MKPMTHSGVLAARIAALSCAFGLLAACVAAPPPQPVHHSQAPPPAQRLNTDVYAYPTQNQPPQQQDRDRYECHEWAVHQTSFDPSAANVPPHDRVRVVGPPPGTATAIGAVSGAILGAAVAHPYEAGAGAVVGAIAGGAVGTAVDAANASHVQQVRVADARQSAALEQKASNYRRAISACLEGRGYSVR
jgi:hypothetical protein